MLGGDVAYLCLAMDSSLRRFRLREEIYRRGRRQGACRRIGVVFRLVETITLHLRIFAEMVFLARTHEEQSNPARAKPGAEESGTHLDATVVAKVSAVQLKVRVFPADVGIQLKGAHGTLLSAKWAAQRKTAHGMKFLHSFYLV